MLDGPFEDQSQCPARQRTAHLDHDAEERADRRHHSSRDNLVPVVVFPGISAIVATGNHHFNVTETIHHGRRSSEMEPRLEATG